MQSRTLRMRKTGNLLEQNMRKNEGHCNRICLLTFVGTLITAILVVFMAPSCAGRDAMLVSVAARSPEGRVILTVRHEGMSYVIEVTGNATGKVVHQSSSNLGSAVYFGATKQILLQEGEGEDARRVILSDGMDEAGYERTEFTAPLEDVPTLGAGIFASPGTQRTYSLGGKVPTGFKLALVELTGGRIIATCPISFDFINSAVMLDGTKIVICGRGKSENPLSEELYLWNHQVKSVDVLQTQYPIYDVLSLGQGLHVVSHEGDFNYGLYTVSDQWQYLKGQRVLDFGYLHSIGVVGKNGIAFIAGPHDRFEDVKLVSQESWEQVRVLINRRQIEEIIRQSVRAAD